MTNQNGLITAEYLLDTQHAFVLALDHVTSFDEFYPLCIEAALTVSSMDCGCIYLADEHGTLRRTFATTHKASCPNYPPIYTPDPGSELVLFPRGQDHGVCVSACIPIYHQQTLLGCLNVASHTLSDISSSIRKALEIIAACMGQTILRLQAQQTHETLRQKMNDMEQRMAHYVNVKEHYRALVESSPDAIGLIDMNWNLAYCNPQTATMFGYDSLEEMLGRSSFDLFPPESHAQVLADMEQLVREHHITVTHQMISRQGDIFPGEVRASVVKDEHGQVRGLFGYIRDISERQQYQEEIEAANAELYQKNVELQQSNALLNRGRSLLYTLIDGLEDGLLLLDANGAILACNQWIARLFDKTPTECVGQSWLACCERMRPSLPGAEALQTLQSGQSHTYRVVYTSFHHDTEQVLSIQSIPLDDPPQSSEDSDVPVCRMIIRMLDITERVEIQSKIIQKERYTSTGRVAATVAHEVNTPLQSIQTMLHLIRNARKPQRETYLSRAIDEIGHIGRILRQLVELSTPVSDIAVPTNINTLVERVLLLTSGPRVSHKITLVSNLDPHLPYFRGHADRVTQIILNLVLNAIDAMPGGGTLTVTTCVMTNDEQEEKLASAIPFVGTPAPAPSALWLAVQIADNGCGIPDGEQHKICNPFYSTKDRPGLGLAVCSQIVQHYHGQLKLSSQPGTGTTVTVLFPQES